MRALPSAMFIESPASIKNLKRMKITSQTHNGFYDNPATFYNCMHTNNTKKVELSVSTLYPNKYNSVILWGPDDDMIRE